MPDKKECPKCGALLNNVVIGDYLINSFIKNNLHVCLLKPRPILTGKYAERFIKNMKDNENKKASPEELSEIKKSADKMDRILKKAKL